MRDLARSMIRFSWAMSVLGAKQAANLVSPRDGWDRSAESFDVVSSAAIDQMGETMKGVYEAGDRFQSGMVDTMSRMFGGGSWDDPGKAMNETWESVERTWSGMKQTVDDAMSADED
ncbi:MAG: hypothetical protein AAF560_07355 [Acidobacteriota bacterium]